jgi:arylsulfatase
VAAQHPDKLRELIARWWVEAGKYNVLPIDGRGQQRFADVRPQTEPPRERYVYYPGRPGGASIPEGTAVKLKNRSHIITAEVEIPAGGAQGILIQQGGRFGGYALGMKNNRLHYVHNYLGIERFVVSSDREVPAGAHTLSFEFEATGAPDITRGKGAPGIGRLFIDGQKAGEIAIPVTIPLTYALAGGGLTCGYSEGTPVIEEYQAPFEFTGTLKRVVVDVSGVPFRDLEAEGRIAMAVQ